MPLVTVSPPTLKTSGGMAGTMYVLVKNSGERRNAENDGCFAVYQSFFKIVERTDDAGGTHDKKGISGRGNGIDAEQIYQYRYGKNAAAATDQPQGEAYENRCRITCYMHGSL